LRGSSRTRQSSGGLIPQRRRTLASSATDRICRHPAAGSEHLDGEPVVERDDIAHRDLCLLDLDRPAELEEVDGASLCRVGSGELPGWDYTTAFDHLDSPTGKRKMTQ
jgi:hypothetical protein